MSPESAEPNDRLASADWPAALAPLVSPVIDTHCHLDLIGQQGGPDVDESVELAAAAGVMRIVQVGTDVASSRWAVGQARRKEAVSAAVALHPNEAPRIHERHGLDGLESAWAEIEQLAADPEVVAIGETGMDFYRTDTPGRAVQEESFRRHIQIARETGKTLIVHDRDAHEDTLRILDDEPGPDRIVLHCFSGDAALVAEAARRGWFCSFAGVVTFKNASVARLAAAVVPDELLLVETDAPFLTPTPHRGRVNGSYLMPLTVRALAEIRGTDEQGMCDLLMQNSRHAFAIE